MKNQWHIKAKAFFLLFLIIASYMGVPVIKHHCHTKNTTSIHLFSFSKKHATECHQSKKTTCSFHHHHSKTKDDCCSIDADLIKNSLHALVHFEFEAKPALLNTLFVVNNTFDFNSFFTSNHFFKQKEKPPLLYGNSFRIALQSFLC